MCVRLLRGHAQCFMVLLRSAVGVGNFAAVWYVHVCVYSLCEPYAILLSALRSSCDSLCAIDLTSILGAQRQHEPTDLPTYDASVIARHAIVRHMHTQRAPPEILLVTNARQFRLEGPQSERCRMTSTWHVAHETMVAAQASATQLGVTLNSFLLGTLAWMLHEASEQQCFVISQTYLGRTMDELHAVGSYSVPVPMVFDFGEEPSLDSVCRHVQGETQRILALDMIMPSSQIPTVAYELNDVRPIERPAEAKRRPSSIVLVDLFFLVNQYSDGYIAMVLYDEGKCDAAWVDSRVERWMELWQGVRECTFDGHFAMSDQL